ncbi:pyridoxal phosphate-dependent aminotransferase [Nocardioides iriomotensis]|uniref:Putative succinyldiaminopimelate transaminase DapC n=1 Tax=Nocardioides iriomotensis TaxID=715784 RepID=A0A4V1Z1F9_9ACTN|nr:pyridoxal phosphate-dependent aminotransferase [Nocardioides iriomotensis]RYU10766.1 putative succinyldiaminopimelate transaminase DapC [Nocardioides iriomotensis]
MVDPSPRTAARLHGIEPTIFAEMSALALRTGALNLGQGFPDVDGPATVVDAAVEAMRTGRNQYAPGPGFPELREAVVAHQQRHYGLDVDPATQVVVTAGATEAIAAALLALVDPGDEVVVLEPFYDSYVACIAMAGGVRRGVTLRAPDFRLDADALRAAVTDRTKLVLLNTPHNPTGAVLTREELQVVADVAVEHDLLVVTDEVYEHLLFDRREHVPICTLPGMWDRTLTISSAGKTFSFTGWKVGWVTGPADLVASVYAAKQWLTFSNAAPMQPAVAEALDKETSFYEELARELEAKRDLLCEGLAGLDVDVYVPEATYFVTTDVRRYGYDDSLAFCLALPERAGVVAIPSQVFYDDREEGRHKVRWAFCKERAVIEKGVRRLAAADLYQTGG